MYISYYILVAIEASVFSVVTQNEAVQRWLTLKMGQICPETSVNN